MAGLAALKKSSGLIDYLPQPRGLIPAAINQMRDDNGNADKKKKKRNRTLDTIAGGGLMRFLN